LSEYAKVSLKRELMDRVEQFIQDYPERGFRSLAQFVEDAVREKAEQLNIYALTPRFRHFNLDEQGVKIQDREIQQTIDINFTPNGIHCTYCHEGDCRHVKFALTVTPIQEVVRKKKAEGWKLPDT
jgi:hypothetical protein